MTVRMIFSDGFSYVEEPALRRFLFLLFRPPHKEARGIAPYKSGGVDKMAKTDTLTVDQQQLVQAWQRTIPTCLNTSDRAEVRADEADSKALWITIVTEGRNGYSFDFKCTYMDSREVKVEFVDVEVDGRNVDERTTVIQTLIDDYVRHIHECAQQLHAMTSK
jgi:fructose-specific phosphotransferase system component IIB